MLKILKDKNKKKIYIPTESITKRGLPRLKVLFSLDALIILKSLAILTLKFILVKTDDGLMFSKLYLSFVFIILKVF
tara:strand:- start:3333 stop:3563 length:231 start_codon:yes stop_codon:yes gene_type:complete